MVPFEPPSGISLFFFLLGVGKIIIFIKDKIRVIEIVLNGVGSHNPDPSPGYIPEADVKSPEFDADDVKNTIRNLGEIHGVEKGWIVHESNGGFVFFIEIGPLDDLDKG